MMHPHSPVDPAAHSAPRHSRRGDGFAVSVESGDRDPADSPGRAARANCQKASGGVVVASVLVQAVAQVHVVDSAAQWAAIAGAGIYSLDVGWKAVRAVWRRYGPDVVLIRFNKFGR
ncbi:hypothetical protein [Nocardia sp. NPDC050710]|uniref:hypothetical protein n=1 Tax=Nocardia sp. NPDC050710 TaxID=3157220 RepID=UPI003400394A